MLGQHKCSSRHTASAAAGPPVATPLKYANTLRTEGAKSSAPWLGRAWCHSRWPNCDRDGVVQVIKHDWIVPAQGDAGAHVSQMIDSGCTSFVLSH